MRQLLFLVQLLALAACASGEPRPDAGQLDARALDALDAPDTEADAQRPDTSAEAAPDAPSDCDPCARLGECCAPAWGPGCELLLRPDDATLEGCRARRAAGVGPRCADGCGAAACELVREAVCR